MYIIRLDDASEYCNLQNWNKIEMLLDKYNVKPIVGIIPQNEDKTLLKYCKNENFWQRAVEWQQKGWNIALHGFNHNYISNSGGLNPVQKRSEFAGVPLNIQKDKIKNGVKILKEKGLNPKIFFAPSHTYDENTLLALKECSDIKIISDTIANDIYYEKDFYFLPQQAGRVRKLPFKFTTFCYHPNEMTNEDFEELEIFISKNINAFKEIDFEKLKTRKKTIFDKILNYIYFVSYSFL